MKPLIFYRMKDILSSVGSKWDELAPSEENAIEFAYEYLNDEPQKMIDTFHYSPEYCLAHYGQDINMRFRENREDEDDRKIAEMISTHTTRKTMVVYRGVCEFVFNHMIQTEKGMEDADLVDKAFLQASLVKGAEIQSDYQLRIYVPKGTEAVYLGNVNDEQFYYEVDIQHGTKLKIISMDKRYINCKIVK